MHLHHPPEVFLSQVLERPARPFAVVDLDEPLLRRQTGALFLTAVDLLRRRAAPLERARDDGSEWDLGEPLPQRNGLLDTVLVELHAGGPTGEDTGGVGRGAAVPDQDHRRHDTKPYEFSLG